MKFAYTHTDSHFLHHFNSSYPQQQSFKLVNPHSKLSSSVISALHRKMCSLESLLAVPPPPTPIGQSGLISPLSWASIPYSKPSATKYPSSKSFCAESELANLPPSAVHSSLDRLRTTYGRLHRRTLHWGPQTPV